MICTGSKWESCRKFSFCMKDILHYTGVFIINVHLIYIYLLTAIGLSPGGSSTVHIYTQTIHRTIQNNQYIEQHHNWRVRAVSRLG
jgi:uncharacterized integral membrane protein